MLEKSIGVRNGEISISKAEWTELNEKYNREELIKAISDAIALHNLPLPFQKPSLEDACKDFSALCELDCSKLLGPPVDKDGNPQELFTKYPYKYSLQNLVIHSARIGNKASDHFHQEARLRCDSINSPSPYRMWTIEKFRLNWLKSLWTIKPLCKEVNNKVLRTSLALRGYTASQFSPSAAKTIYEFLGSKAVLDFSSGWGDRFTAFCASKNTEFYLGIDPNESLFDGYKQQKERFLLRKRGALFVNSPAENCDIYEYWRELAHHSMQYDTIFTSPPYFNAERYTQELNQSWKRYRKLNIWLENFLFVTLRNAWKFLEKDGYLALNIADVYTGHKINKICDPMNDFISTLPNAKYCGGIGLRMAKRPMSASDKRDENGKSTGIYVEPIWIWQKR